MDVGIVLTAAGTVVAVVGSNIALISWLRADMKSFETEIRSDMKSFETKVDGWKEEIQKESKDFHGRLERQDAEFKAHLMHFYEERSKK